jgi:exopolysaccharide biosynthesis polyprenyl glycosylphosphotransferase
MLTKRTYPRTQNFLLLLLLIGDSLFAFAGLILGYIVRFETPLRHFGVDPGDITFETYLPLLVLGTLFLVTTFAYLKVYDGRVLLRPHRSSLTITKATCFWFAAFLGVSLALKFEPSVSRIFVAISCLTTLVVVLAWRSLFHAVLQRTQIRDRIAQRVILIGWSKEAEQLLRAINGDNNHPYVITGFVATRPEHQDEANRPGCPLLGRFQDLAGLLQNAHIDIVIVTDFGLNSDQLLTVSDLCERFYVQFKILPSFFRIFVSSLRLQTISGVPVLGVEELKVLSVLNAAAKRVVDIFGALVGLAISAPIMLVLAILIRRESRGPVIYRQIRTGRHGRPFTIYKLRSMRLDAEKSGAQWAVSGDPRRLKIGAFMREWNLDELPQFWNVLIGDMSLVGPRPERPELIQKFEREIPHYNPRHAVRPGVTGWAQVNGLRGNTSLVDRIKYDLYYIENWSFWFDLQIMLQTFTENKNAY